VQSAVQVFVSLGARHADCHGGGQSGETREKKKTLPQKITTMRKPF